MHHTRTIDAVGEALVDLMSIFASPQRDEALLREAGVKIDRALFPLLVRLSLRGPLSVAALGAEVGRDHTTISRQLARLETLGLIDRPSGDADRRVRPAVLTPAGEQMVQAIVGARRRLLSKVLADWDEADLAALGALNRRFADALVDAVR